jgi:RNA 2',3'-cyclic 3'-phosphodiesterase
MTSEPTRRLFFALWPDESMQAALAEATHSIIRAGDGRAIPAENLHLTLAFLGSVPESRIPALSPIAAEVAATFPELAQPIAVTLDTAEYWRKPQLLCATASAPPSAAAALARALKDALVARGFAPDLKPFRVHATFARKVRRVSGDLSLPPVAWTFVDFRLIESRTVGESSSYSTREKWALYARPR